MGRLVFRSGFEGGSTVVPEGDYDGITGADHSLKPPNDWDKHLKGYEKFGIFRIQYQGGSVEHRRARIVPDPSDTGNRVLHFWLKHPNTPNGPNGLKGRIQANIYQNTNLTEVYQKRRLFLHPDMNLLRGYQKVFNWLTLEELWLPACWINHPFAFRINLHLSKAEGTGQPFYFYANGQKHNEVGKGWGPLVWERTNREFEVPVAKWMTLETYYRQGDGKSGRFVITAKTEETERQTIFDVTDWTYHPDSPEPVPMTHWNPLKLYTSVELINHVREAGGIMQLYFDDLEIWDGWPSGPAAAKTQSL